MSEHIWEELVQSYITANRAMLVSPQYEVSDEHGWNICPDFLAIDFRAHQIWFVEGNERLENKQNHRQSKQV